VLFNPQTPFIDCVFFDTSDVELDFSIFGIEHLELVPLHPASSVIALTEKDKVRAPRILSSR
jgi:hypothetical protein